VPGSNRLYNVAFGHTETVNSLYQRIREKIGSTLDPVYEPPRPGEIKDSFADTTQAQKHLGYMPEVSLVAVIDADKEAVKSYAKLVALKNMTPAQVSSWVDANVTNLSQAQDAIKTLAIGMGYIIRQIF